MSISKKLRFEVFKRDKFTCQYCGRTAPDVILEVDHIHPKAANGKDDIMNLVTSCYDCNRGKGKRQLSDDAVLKKRKAQLDLIQERCEQLEMLMQWQQSLVDIETQTAEELHKVWKQLASYGLTETGINSLRKWMRRFSVVEIAEAMRISVRQYLQYTDDKPTVPTIESAGKAFDYVPRICVGQKRAIEKPYLKDLYYVRGILKHRLTYLKEWEALQMLEEVYLAGVTIDQLKEMAKTVKSWTAFKAAIQNFLTPKTDGTDDNTV